MHDLNAHENDVWLGLSTFQQLVSQVPHTVLPMYPSPDLQGPNIPVSGIPTHLSLNP